MLPHLMPLSSGDVPLSLRRYLLYVYALAYTPYAQTCRYLIDHPVRSPYYQYRRRLHLPDGRHRLISVVIIGEQSRLDSAYLGLLPFGGYPGYDLIATDEQPVIYDTLYVSLLTQVHSLKTFSCPAFPYKSVNFHLEFLIKVCYNQFVI